MKKKVFSGVQPSGNLHIGNYLGAIRNWVEIQHQYDNTFCVVDAHAITVPQDPEVLRDKSREVAAIYIACGIDPEESVIFIQSHVPAHFQLTWILNCITPMGWLNRMTQFKEKAGEERESVSTGLYDYPVLMASDILLYDTDLVPVGADQIQHIELTRDIAQRFNYLFGETFKLPEALVRETGARIMALDEPTKKMSKSSESPMGAVDILDTPDAIRRKIMRAVTDPLRDITFDPARHGLYNLLTVYQLFSGWSPEQIETHFRGKGYADLKRELADLVIESLRPIQERYRQLRSDPQTIEDILRRGAERAAPVADAKVAQVKERIGLG
ncbi:MAG: tryptophan--tRNA ligase [Anaerolineae bacterium]|nr:tryptophan--tRNA ligase [Anaerolineae bacterium]